MTAPSEWVQRWARLIAPGASVLDLACGSGRHVHWLAAQGFRVTGVDRDAQALAPLQAVAEVQVADLEAPGPWPLAGRRFDAVVVTNYLWRPRFADVLSLLAADSVFIYETFAAGHAALGRPTRADFLLQPGELLERCSALRVVAYEDGRLENPARQVQRIAALGPQPRTDRIARL